MYLPIDLMINTLLSVIQIQDKQQQRVGSAGMGINCGGRSSVTNAQTSAK